MRTRDGGKYKPTHEKKGRIIFQLVRVDSIFVNFYLYLLELIFNARAKLTSTYSQYGEDRLFLDYFKGRQGIFIDVGASHPFIISNTYLLYRHEWWGVTVEPIPCLFKRQRKYRSRDIELNIRMRDKEGYPKFYQMIPTVLSTFDKREPQDLIWNSEILRSKNTIKVSPLAELYQENLACKKINLLSVDA